MPAIEQNLTALLHAWRGGDAAAFAQLSGAVYQALHKMAHLRLGAERSATLQPTELVHEAFLRIMGADIQWADRAHFFAVVARNMRAALVDHARARAADKRGAGAVRVTLDEKLVAPEQSAADLLVLDFALQRLSKIDARASEVIELTYFGGLERPEIAEVLALSVPTIDRALRFGRAWLARECAA